MSLKQYSDIQNVYYINLSERTDKKEYVEKQLSSIDLKGTRFNALKYTPDWIGCTLSHIKCLEIAIKNNFNHILICEDDITFLNPTFFKQQVDEFLKTHNNWDVILLAGNNADKYKEKDNTSVKINKCASAMGYIVNSHYYQTLMNNFKESVVFRIPIDVYWFSLQKKDNWFLIFPLSVTQLASYSDIKDDL